MFRRDVPRAQAKTEDTGPKTLILITHETHESNIRAALEAISKDGYMAAEPQMIRIEEMA